MTRNTLLQGAYCCSGHFCRILFHLPNGCLLTGRVAFDQIVIKDTSESLTPKYRLHGFTIVIATFTIPAVGFFFMIRVYIPFSFREVPSLRYALRTCRDASSVNFQSEEISQVLL
mmetsp:Transcript_117647/g.340107  ORF Transcript_117647/g.340107 Transcript_117647/m.340107 type:complete len:115 (-) Transcript_117647:428-772(-)